MEALNDYRKSIMSRFGLGNRKIQKDISAQDCAAQVHLYSGYIRKHSGKKKWDFFSSNNLLFVVLCHDSLYVFSNDRANKPKVALGLRGYNMVQRASELEANNEKWAFRIVHARHDQPTHVFSTSSQKDMQLWMKHIKAALLVANGRQEDAAEFLQQSRTEGDGGEENAVDFGVIESSVYDQLLLNTMPDDSLTDDFFSDDDSAGSVPSDSSFSPLSPNPSISGVSRGSPQTKHSYLPVIDPKSPLFRTGTPPKGRPPFLPKPTLPSRNEGKIPESPPKKGVSGIMEQLASKINLSQTPPVRKKPTVKVVPFSNRNDCLSKTPPIIPTRPDMGGGRLSPLGKSRSQSVKTEILEKLQDDAALRTQSDGYEILAAEDESQYDTCLNTGAERLDETNTDDYWKGIYFTGQDKNEAKQVLKKIATDGVYLVRDSENGGKVLAVYSAQAKNTIQFRIIIDTDKEQYSLNDEQHFDTIESLVHNHYSQPIPGKSNLFLTRPYRFALQDLNIS